MPYYQNYMGRLYDELWERVSDKFGPPIIDGLKIIHLRQPRYEEIEESDEVLIFDVVRHESADGCPFEGGPGAFMYFETRRYHYRGGDDITMDVIGERKLVIDENAFLIREVENNLQYHWDETNKEWLRSALASLDYSIQRELYEVEGMDFEFFLDKLAQELHYRLPEGDGEC